MHRAWTWTWTGRAEGTRIAKAPREQIMSPFNHPFNRPVAFYFPIGVVKACRLRSIGLGEKEWGRNRERLQCSSTRIKRPSG